MNGLRDLGGYGGAMDERIPKQNPSGDLLQTVVCDPRHHTGLTPLDARGVGAGTRFTIFEHSLNILTLILTLILHTHSYTHILTLILKLIDHFLFLGYQ
jgi:hypothetical protein